eukprot:TRINITY_DN16562_c0_g1_i1.p1 TRINITY_DN16562_c0_g1~~TRINITY_DN16562_c0_g1_i1.p1  ORF type:complete len:126 (+),score=13.56 TRINITY_DN16562_c0_g1_i1:33-380(+)
MCIRDRLKGMKAPNENTNYAVPPHFRRTSRGSFVDSVNHTPHISPATRANSSTSSFIKDNFTHAHQSFVKGMKLSGFGQSLAFKKANRAEDTLKMNGSSGNLVTKIKSKLTSAKD